MADFKKGDQVVVRRVVRNFPKSVEVKVGTLLSLSANGEKASVSLPLPGGRIQRAEVEVSQLEPVTARFKRASVQFNPAFRQVI